MSREIIFRGKIYDDEYGAWAEGFLSSEDHINVYENYQWTEYDVDPNTVGQYTGLTDKNGKRIFEGDIVVWTSERTRLIGHYGYDLHKGYYKGDLLQVIYNEAGFMLATLTDSMLDVPNANAKVDNYAFWNYHRQLEIIGNIHDNKEFDAQNGEEKEE